MQHHERARSALVGLLGIAFAAGAIALLAGPLRAAGVAVPGTELPWWALAPVFAVTELVVASVQVRRESLSISFAEVPLVLGLAFCDPLGFVAASLVGSLVGLLHHRQTGLKLFFNLALFALEAALAQFVYHAVLAGSDPTDVRGFLAAVAAIVVTQLVSALVVTVAILIMAGRYDGGIFREAMTSTTVAALANSSVGLLVVVLVTSRPSALVLLIVVVGALALAYRGYSTLSRGHARLESLYRFTDRLGTAVRTDAVAEAVLAEARDVLTAETSELVLLPGEGRPGDHLRMGPEGLTRVPAGDPAGWWQPALAGRSLLHPRGEDGPSGIRDAVVAPLRIGDTTVGALVVRDRPHHLDTFGDADVKLLASLANHASLSLHKAHLVDQLAAEAAAQEHRSLHDPLTGLPNRHHFLRLLRDRLAVDEATAVVMLDLDGFKDINDALGHETGDLLLAEVGRRLAARLGDGSVARFGNDEFAALLPPSADVEDARAHTVALVTALSVPFPVRGLAVDVRLSAGMARAPEHGDEPSALLQHADTALYAAKQQGRDVGVYDAAADGAAARLQMTGDLRDAIADGVLEVRYQPKADPGTGRPAGMEALVRWTHPVHGQVSPDEFIPLAEHTGLIRPLTTFVLDTALRACAQWRRSGHHLGVAVNLSTRSLADADLPAQVRDALTAARLPAAALTLEITETAVMSDLARSLAVLQELRALGVRLSVDDFGTGQSSLAYLKRLPIHEMKIDKGFVTGLADDRGDAAIVRAAIELGHALGLRVVAEGVEDRTTQALLADWGCDLVQGYHVSRPLFAGHVDAWLAAVARPDVAGPVLTA